MDKAEFASRPVGMINENRHKKYAVLVPILETPDGNCLLFEKRAADLRRQPGEVCFPGGKLEPGESSSDCALREAAEELCIHASQIDILGPGDVFVSPFDLIIYPFIGILRDYRYTYNPAEVAEVFTVPVSYFVSHPPETYKSAVVSQRPEGFPYERIPGGESYSWARGSYDVLFYRNPGHSIWGITAYIVQSAAELINRYGLGS